MSKQQLATSAEIFETEYSPTPGKKTLSALSSEPSPKRHIWLPKPFAQHVAVPADEWSGQVGSEEQSARVLFMVRLSRKSRSRKSRGGRDTRGLLAPRRRVPRSFSIAAMHSMGRKRRDAPRSSCGCSQQTSTPSTSVCSASSPRIDCSPSGIASSLCIDERSCEARSMPPEMHVVVGVSSPDPLITVMTELDADARDVG